MVDLVYEVETKLFSTDVEKLHAQYVRKYRTAIKNSSKVKFLGHNTAINTEQSIWEENRLRGGSKDRLDCWKIANYEVHGPIIITVHDRDRRA